MANGTPTAPGLSLPREAFAKLTPRPFLQAHLTPPNDIRPNGRTPREFRAPTINTGSLTHSNGSAVVRLGDTAVVCGVRAEILLASDIPHPARPNVDDSDLIEELGLLVPNLELSTGCAPAYLPGNPPGSLAQTLSYRILSLLNTSGLIRADALSIPYTEPHTQMDVPDEEPQTVVKAYWTLYIDILCIALDGNPFDAAWAAVLAALQTTVLPQAWWDPEREMIVCSPLAADARQLRLHCVPMASSFAVFSTISPITEGDETTNWILADPDGFEEDVCTEAFTVVVAPQGSGLGPILRLEKSGGLVIGTEMLSQCVQLAEDRWAQWHAAFAAG